YIRFKDAVVYYQKALESLDEAIKKRAEDQEEAAELYYFAYEQYEKAAADFSQSAEKLLGKKGANHDGQKIEITFNESANYAVSSALSFTKAAEYALKVSKAQGAKLQELDDLLRYHIAAELYAHAAKERRGRAPRRAKEMHNLAEKFIRPALILADESKSSDPEEEKFFDVPKNLITEWMESRGDVEKRKSSFDLILTHIRDNVRIEDSRTQDHTDEANTDSESVSSLDSEGVDLALINRLLTSAQRYTDEANNLKENQQEGLASIASFVASTKKDAATSWEELQRDQALVNQPGTSEFADLRRQATQKTDYANNLDKKYKSIKKSIGEFQNQYPIYLLTERYNEEQKNLSLIKEEKEEKEEWGHLSALSGNILGRFEELVKVQQPIENEEKLNFFIESIASLHNTFYLISEASGCIKSHKIEASQKFQEAIQTMLEIANLSFDDFDRLSEFQARAKSQTEEATNLKDGLVSASNQDVSLGMISESSEKEPNDLEWDQQKAVEELSELTLKSYVVTDQEIAAEYSTKERQVRHNGKNELADLWALVQKSFHYITQFSHFSKSTDSTEREIFELYTKSFENFKASAEKYEEIEKAFEKKAFDEADLWVQATKNLLESAKTWEEAATSLSELTHGKKNGADDSSKLEEAKKGFKKIALCAHNKANIIIDFVNRVATSNQEIATAIQNSSLKEEWEKLSPEEREKEAEILLNIAYDATNEADEAYAIALDAAKEESWNEAKQKAEEARSAWSETAEVLKVGLLLSTEKFKEWWTNRINIAENKKTNWANALLSYELPKEGDSYELSKEDLKEFHYATLVDVSQPVDFEGSKPCEKKQARILKAMYHNPYIHVEEIIDIKDHQPPTVVSRNEMVADHLLVTLEAGKDPGKFREELENLLKDEYPTLVTSIDEIVSSRFLYQLNFKLSSLFYPVSLKLVSKILECSKQLAVRSNPNIISNLSTFPNDPIYRPPSD
ncbi:MAG: hypothetical protein ACH349_07370, partial [Candidatus Rhabdochlamydia sp.]